MTFITEVTRYNGGPHLILVSKSIAPGLYAARIKSTASGAFADIIIQVREHGKSRAFTIPSGTAGLEKGDQVAVRLTAIDIDEWLDMNDSIPLMTFSLNQREASE